MPKYKVLVTKIKKISEFVEVEAEDKNFALKAAESRALFGCGEYVVKFNESAYSATYKAVLAIEV